MDKILTSFIIASIISMSILTIYVVYAQTPVEKTFSKCDIDTTLLDSMNLSYDVYGCPTATITIHNWENIPTLEQNLIISDMTSKGYIEVISDANVETLEEVK